MPKYSQLRIETETRDRLNDVKAQKVAMYGVHLTTSELVDVLLQNVLDADPVMAERVEVMAGMRKPGRAE